MGIGYVKWRKTDEGQRCFEEALKLDPAFEDARYNAEVIAKKKAEKAARKPDGAAAPKAAFENLDSLDETFGMGIDSDKGGLNFSTDFDDGMDDDDDYE